MVKIYADLVELGLRTLEPNEEGILLVPAFLKDSVIAELERRSTTT